MKADKSFDVANTFMLLDGYWYGANWLGFGSANISLPQSEKLSLSYGRHCSKPGCNRYPLAYCSGYEHLERHLQESRCAWKLASFSPVEEGLGCFMVSLNFYGGAGGFILGNQQCSMENRNI
jgi:hypothetical protein